MKHISLNKGQLGGLLEGLRKALENNKPPNTLFDVEPDWPQLDKGRCPVCGTKLRLVPHRNPVRAICAGKRHGDKAKFIISMAKLKGDIKVH